MGKAIAQQNSIHISPRKAGLICDLIRFKSTNEALSILTNLDKKGSEIILKLLKSAISNATHNHALDATKLYVLQALANQAKMIKRTMPKARGSAALIRKRHSNIIIIVSDNQSDRLPVKKSKKPVARKELTK
ncbi:MAG: 50S ribosomal protein L22 [Mycoplasmataceae bacterium]|jgi:large subunit ribosomal protein L22|nr:50S ribosomal protein L22 [Mycoplasmataceae bacterium]